MHPHWNLWLKRGGTALDSPPLRRGEKSLRGTDDPKWKLGDLALEIPEPLVDAFAQALGEDKGSLRRLLDVSRKWPPERRVAASWSAHRELKDHPSRFSLIYPGMSVRAAAEAAGKGPIDARPPERMTTAERVDEAMLLLADKNVNDLVLEQLVERRQKRRMIRAARAAQDDRSAEFKEAQRELREAQSAKSPERAFLEVVFRIREEAEYLRAVHAAVMDPVDSLVPEHRKPDLISAMENLLDIANTNLRELGGKAGTTAIQSGVVIDVVPSQADSSRTANLLDPTAASDSDQ